MEKAEARRQWEQAALGWAKWEEHFDRSMATVSETMLEMAGVAPGARVLDLACGTGSQTIDVARRVGPRGEVIAADISESMLQYVLQKARAAHLDNVVTVAAAVDELRLPPNSLDAAVCRFALMHFPDPVGALVKVKEGLKPGARVAAVVYSGPEHNAFMVKPMQILLRHAGKEPPAAGSPGIFALGKPGALQQRFMDAGYRDYEQQIATAFLHLPSSVEALRMIQEAFGAYRAVINDSPEPVRKAAWDEVAEMLREFETPQGFAAPSEVIIGAAARAED